MAEIPVPRSYSQLLGDMVDAFLSRYGLRSLKVGSPVLSILESVAQSQMRSSEDIFTLLEAQSLDNATGQALDRIGSDESTPRILQNPASGAVSITDTSFTKLSSKIYQGSSAPIVGTTALNVVDASLFPASGSVYIGRGTSNYEGPIAYTSKVNNGTYWTLNLSGTTLRFHNQGESVVVAQGGDRQVAAGTTVQTPQGNASAAIQFKTLFSSTIPDGETFIQGVLVVAVQAGIIGNVAVNAINGFSSTPFANATVANPLPFTNGTAVEDDDTYRERIRQARQSRQKGTPLAIQTNAVGVTANDENKRVQSASVVDRQGLPTTLFIDDGTGYEMNASGIAIETLADQALGGEQYFKVSQRPVAKAYVQTTITAPYTLASGMKLGFAVNGVVTEHTFSATDFRSASNATAYEIVASINSDATLLWQARTVNQGTQVVVTAKADTNESIQNTVPVTGIDANPYLGFPTGLVTTMRLYKDDRLLSKDGTAPQLTSVSFSKWSAMSGPQSFIIAVDGITLKFDGTMFPKFQDQDFINAATGYTTLGKNSAAAWAAVFNYRIPGITATVQAGNVVLTSNRGTSALASISISPCDLVTNNMWLAISAQGSSNDYTLNRNTGELAISSALLTGSKLAAGSSATRGFLNTPTIATINLAAAGNMWFAVDLKASIVQTGITSTTSLTFTASAKSWGFRVRCTAGSAVFSNLLAGDLVVFWDASISGSIFGTYRICGVDAGGTWFEIEKAATYTAGPITLPNAGMSFVRSAKSRPMQKVVVPLGSNYTATSFASTISPLLIGATAVTYRTNVLRVATTTFAATGDIALAAADVNGQQVTLPVGGYVSSLTGQMASAEAGNAEHGTPEFAERVISTVTSGTSVRINSNAAVAPFVNSFFFALRAQDDSLAAGNVRYSSSHGFRSTLVSQTFNSANLYDIVLKTGPEQLWCVADRVYLTNPYMIAPDDTFNVLVDGNATTERFNINMWRTLKPNSSTYSSSNTLKDADNGGASLVNAFGSSFDFNDFAVHMSARAKTDTASSTKAILWRFNRLGPDGNNVRIQYKNPLLPSQPVSFTVDNTTNATTDVGIVLSSGALRSGASFRASSYIGYVITTPVSGVSTITYIGGYAVSSATWTTSQNVLTLTLPAGCSDHGLNVSDVIYLNSSNGAVPSGAKTITARTATTVTYAETFASGSTGANIGTVSKDPAGEVTLTGSNIVVGDFFYMPANNPFGTPPAMRVNTIDVSAKAQYWTGTVAYGGAAVATTSWALLASLPNITFYANPAQTSAALTTAFQALTAPILRPTLIGDGTGIIDRSSDETAAASPTWLNLTDGVNYVQTTTIGGDYTLLFKNPITAGLATSSDWLNEVIHIVPNTAKNVSDYFNTLGVTGLSSVAEVTRSSGSIKVQIASLTPGSVGSVQVQGGTSNICAASVMSSAVSGGGNTAIAYIPTANATGFFAGMYVAVNNTNPVSKSGVFDLNTNLTSIGADGTFTLNAGGTPCFTLAAASTASAVFQIEAQGLFVAFNDTGLGTAPTLAGVSEGDWVQISTPATPVTSVPISPADVGLFRVVRVMQPGINHAGTFWIENPNYVAQNTAECDIKFIKYGSLIPGDTIKISTPLWGSTNQGTWTVLSVGGTTPWGNTFTFKVDVSTRAISTSVTPGPLGSTNANLVQCIEGSPSRLIKKILCVSQDGSDPTITDIKFTTQSGYQRINATAGSVLNALDKMAFPTSVITGIDGYRYSTGLIKACNQVEYGDPSNPAVFPGVVAAGANVNIEAAPIKRIQVSIALRVRSGAATTDIAASAKSAVASVINGTDIGEAIALSDIASAARVAGVISVVMINPQQIVGSDLISVQAYEKPRVLNLDTDILISFIGE